MSLDESLARLLEEINPLPPDPDPEETRRQAERDLEEIRLLGLEERAFDELASRLPGTVLHECRISYFITKETVWCDARYTLPDGMEILQKEFGFRKLSAGQWELIWHDQGMIDEP